MSSTQMTDLPPVDDDLPTEDISVGLLASITLHHTVIFLVCQLLIIMFLTVPFMIIPALGWYSEETGAIVMLVMWGLIEVVFLYLLAIDGRKRYRSAITQGDPRLDIITEARIEAAAGTMAGAMFVLSFVYGMGAFGLIIMLTVA